MAVADGVLINVCVRNRESAECLALDAATTRRPDKITPDMVDPHPVSSASIYSEDSWRHYWADRFHALGRALAPIVFTHLESKDANPGDGFLDLSSVPRESAGYVFDHLYPVDENQSSTQDTLDAMRADVVHTQKRLIPIYITKVGSQLIGATETGTVRALVGDDLQRAWDEMHKMYPNEDVARVVVDARYFAGRDTADLNPDRKGMWAPLLYKDASLAASGGVGVFDPTREISAVPYSTRTPGFGPGELDNFITVLSAALLMLAMLRRSGGASVPVVAAEPHGNPSASRFDAMIPSGMMSKLQWAVATRGRGIPNFFMSSVKRLAKQPEPVPVPEAPKNEWYRLPDGITNANVPLVGRSYVQGSMTMRPITPHGLVHYVTDTRGAAHREGFALLREQEGLAPLFIPIELMRKAVAQGDIAQTPFRAPYKMPSVPFRDPATGELFQIFPSWNLHPNPARNNGQPFDPHAQIVGVVVKNCKGELVLSLPWVEGWMAHSPMTYEPLRESPYRWVVPHGWRGGAITLMQRTDAAGALLSRIPTMRGINAQQQDALSMLAAAMANPKLDAEAASLATHAVMQGRRSTVYLANQISDSLRGLPVEWAFNRSLAVGLDAQESLAPMILKSIEACVTRTHDVFPALNSSPTLFPPPGGARPYSPSQRKTSKPVIDVKQPGK